MFDRKAYMKEYMKKYRETHSRKHYNDNMRKWKKENPEKVALAQRKCKIKRNFGITLEDYDRMFEEQKGLCAICGGDTPNKKLAIDHNHETGEVRGLLCLRCNTKLGWYETLEDSIQRYLS